MCGLWIRPLADADPQNILSDPRTDSGSLVDENLTDTDRVSGKR